MKKIYSLILVSALLFVFTTCNKKDDDPKPVEDPTPAKPLVYQAHLAHPEEPPW